VRGDAPARLQSGLRSASGGRPRSGRGLLRYLEDLSTRELAAVLGLSESAVKMRQLRALRRLRDLLGGDLAEDLP
jgi:hypothetical protein